MMTILVLALLIISQGDTAQKETGQTDEKDPYRRESYQADLGIALLSGKSQLRAR